MIGTELQNSRASIVYTFQHFAFLKWSRIRNCKHSSQLPLSMKNNIAAYRKKLCLKSETLSESAYPKGVFINTSDI